MAKQIIVGDQSAENIGTPKDGTQKNNWDSIGHDILDFCK
jgi:hypothetical protein